MNDTQKSDNINLSENNGLCLNISGKTQKNKKKIWPVVIIIAICVCVLAGFLWKPVYNLFQKDEPKTIQDYEKHYLNQQIDSFLKFYDLINVSAPEEPEGLRVKASFFADPFILKLIKKEYPQLNFIEKLNNMSMDTVMKNDGNLLQIYLESNNPELQLPSVEITADSEEKSLYLSMPSITSDIFKFETDEFREIHEILTLLSNLPNESQAEQFLTDYVTCITGLMQQQSVETKKLCIDEYECKCTVYSCHIDQTLFLQYTLQLFEQCFVDDTSETVTTVKGYIAQCMENTTEQDYIVWSICVDERDNIIGRTIELSSGVGIFHYLYIEDKENIALDFELIDFEISGFATVEDTIEGDFYLYIDEVQYLKLSAEDLIIKDGIIKGSVQLTPSDKLVNLVLNSDPGVPVSFEITFDLSSTGGNVNISYMNMIDLVFETERIKVDSVEKPTGNIMDGSAFDAFYQWIKDIN